MNKDNNQQQIFLSATQKKFCSRHIYDFEEKNWWVSLAGKAGSDRQFFRLHSQDSNEPNKILIVWNTIDDDWDRFFTINEQIIQKLPILPTIYAAEKGLGLILEEDCGIYTLKDLCSKETDTTIIENLYTQVLDLLIKWHALGIEIKSPISSRILDKHMLLWETNYFALHCVNENFGLKYLLNSSWEKERMALAEEVASLPLVSIHRDFQSENIIVNSGTIKFVDFQGARLGPAEYDLASLLFDPYISVLNNIQRYWLLNYYTEKSQHQISEHTFHLSAIQRLSQALGAYANLSLNKGKKHYQKFIPPALKTLLAILEKENEYPIFRHITQSCLNKIK